MNGLWLAVVVTGLATIAMKAVAPLLLGGRPLPPRVAGVLRLLAPALLAAFVATQTFTSGGGLGIDARVAGVAAAAVAVWLRAPLLVVVAVAAATAAVVRVISG